MPGGLIRSGTVRRKAASAMSGVESSAKALGNDIDCMLQPCTHPGGFAKGSSGNRKDYFVLRQITSSLLRRSTNASILPVASQRNRIRPSTPLRKKISDVSG